MREPTDFASYSVSLIVVSGAGEGEEHAMERPRWLVGQSREADVAFEDASLDARHGVIEFDAGRFLVTDLDSAAGTRVNGEAVSSCEVRHGDRVAFGDCVLQILIERTDDVPLFPTSARDQTSGEEAGA